MVDRAIKPEKLLAEHMLRLGRVNIDVDARSALAIVATIQLALRHPQFKRSITGRNMRNFVDQLIVKFAAGDDEIAEFLRRGDDPSYDVITPNAES